MKVLSLFDGISCGRVALEKGGHEVEKYVAYEIEENAIKVSKANYPDIEHKGDVFKAEYQEGEFDLLIGGSPCTYWSIAGARNNGARETKASGLGWDLFSQYVRALREAKPRWFLYENNASMSDEIRECITKELGCEPILIDSSGYSAQHRRRLYWTNIPFDSCHEDSKVLFKDILFEEGNKVKSFEKYKDTMRVSPDGLCVSWDTSGKGNYSQQNRARKTEQKWNTLPSSGIDKNNVWLGGCNFRNVNPVEAERLQCLPDNYTSCLDSRVKRVEVCGNGWTVDVIVHLLSGLKEGKD